MISDRSRKTSSFKAKEWTNVNIATKIQGRITIHYNETVLSCGLIYGMEVRAFDFKTAEIFK